MENPLYPAQITDALRNVRYPGSGKDIVSLGMVAVTYTHLRAHETNANLV